MSEPDYEAIGRQFIAAMSQLDTQTSQLTRAQISAMSPEEVLAADAAGRTKDLKAGKEPYQQGTPRGKSRVKGSMSDAALRELAKIPTTNTQED